MLPEPAKAAGRSSRRGSAAVRVRGGVGTDDSGSAAAGGTAAVCGAGFRTAGFCAPSVRASALPPAAGWSPPAAAGPAGGGEVVTTVSPATAAAGGGDAGSASACILTGSPPLDSRRISSQTPTTTTAPPAPQASSRPQSTPTRVMVTVSRSHTSGRPPPAPGAPSPLERP